MLLLGEEPIEAFDDITSKPARICSEFYALSINSVLEDGKWPFATKEVEAEQITNLDEYSKEQKHIYEIPCDSAIIARVYKRSARKNFNWKLDWDIRYFPELHNSAIICTGPEKPEEETEEPIPDDEKIYIEYISENVCPNSYSAAFIKCVVAQLAADICMPITHDQQRWANMLQYSVQMKQHALQLALNEDGQDKGRWVDPITLSRRGF